jgi:hypothetical protein
MGSPFELVATRAQEQLERRRCGQPATPRSASSRVSRVARWPSSGPPGHEQLAQEAIALPGVGVEMLLGVRSADALALARTHRGCGASCAATDTTSSS